MSEEETDAIAREIVAHFGVPLTEAREVIAAGLSSFLTEG